MNEISVVRSISQLIVQGHGLFLANDMPIRDMDMYAASGKMLYAWGANRGAEWY